jgi:hypothetical protein
VRARAAELGCAAIDFELARGNHAARRVLGWRSSRGS